MNDLAKYYKLYKDTEAEIDEESHNSRNSNVLFIDGLNTFIRSWSVVPTLNENGEHVGGVQGFLRSIANAVLELNPSRIVVVFDGRNSSKRKQSVYSNYKSTRANNKLRVNRGIYEQHNDEEEDDSRRRQLIMTAEFLMTLPITVMLYEGVEADDVIGYCCRQLNEQRSVIMSTDKDFLQLVNDDVTVWSPVKKKLYTKEAVLHEYEIPAHNFLLYRICDGDSSDNINGIKGMGRKTLLKRFPLVQNNHKISIDELVKYASEHRGKQSIYDTLLDNVDVLSRNYTLMQLEEVDLNGVIKGQIQGRFRESTNALNKVEFIKLLTKYKMADSFKDPLGWLSVTFRNIK